VDPAEVSTPDLLQLFDPVAADGDVTRELQGLLVLESILHLNPFRPKSIGGKFLSSELKQEYSCQPPTLQKTELNAKSNFTLLLNHRPQSKCLLW
jgi:hypothetical protein